MDWMSISLKKPRHFPNVYFFSGFSATLFELEVFLFHDILTHRSNISSPIISHPVKRDRQQLTKLAYHNPPKLDDSFLDLLPIFEHDVV